MKWCYALFKRSLSFLLRAKDVAATIVLTCQELFKKSLVEAYRFTLMVSFKVCDPV